MIGVNKARAADAHKVQVKFSSGAYWTFVPWHGHIGPGLGIRAGTRREAKTFTFVLGNYDTTWQVRADGLDVTYVPSSHAWLLEPVGYPGKQVFRSTEIGKYGLPVWQAGNYVPEPGKLNAYLKTASPPLTANPDASIRLITLG
jgi:hypothetical protein